MKKITFLGAGNMGGAIISGMIKSGSFPGECICAYDRFFSDSIKAAGIKCTDSLPEALAFADAVVLAVKPGQLFGLIDDIKSCADISSKLFVSIAAGVKIEDIAAALGTEKIVRVMPNLCLKAGEGMSVLCAGEAVTNEEVEFAQRIFACSGKTVVTREALMDSCTAINGSGPAYVFMFIEAMADGAVKHGIDRKTAYELAAQTVMGSAAMVLESGLHPAELKDMVCSPGGTTIEAVQVLEECGMRASVMAAIDACAEKAKELGK